MAFEELEEFDYDSLIENHVRDVVQEVYGNEIEVEINHTQANQQIYEDLENKLQTQAYACYIRSDAVTYDSSSATNKLYRVDNNISVIIAADVNAEKRGSKNISRLNKKIARVISKKLAKNNLIISGEICHFRKKTIRTIFNDNKIDICFLDLSIEYMEK